MKEVNRLSRLQGVSTESVQQQAAPPSQRLPIWAKLAVNLMIEKFDSDQDGSLNATEYAVFAVGCVSPWNHINQS
jgi:hypothetical protein